MTPQPNQRSVVERWAKDLLRALAGGQNQQGVRVADAEGGLAVLVQVWPAGSMMPTVAGPPRRRGDHREACRADILAVFHAVGRPLTRKEVVRR